VYIYARVGWFLVDDHLRDFGPSWDIYARGRVFVIVPMVMLLGDLWQYGIIFVAKSLSCESGSSVSIVSSYGLDERAIEVRSPAEAKGIFL
jgi:hypothetical protein